MFEEHRFIQGMFAFKGRGLETPVSLEPKAIYQVPPDKRAQLIYCRVGNPTPEFLYLVLQRDGRPMRLFPCGGKSGIHVPLAIIDDIHADCVLELVIAAPEGLAAKVMIDMGFMEDRSAADAVLGDPMLANLISKDPGNLERWVIVSVDEAYMHCSKHIPSMRKIDHEVDWGTDDVRAKGGDYFAAAPPKVIAAQHAGWPMLLAMRLSPK